MPGGTEATGPSYISSHSADVILSDIRPTKLKLEALRSINVLLDEFLFNILSNASSLSTDRLRASLLSILPTSLGKEALLEAEVELRAYWDRTARPAALEDDSQTFNLQWAFELLRLKCEAYSTLNESDEDSAAVAQLQERMAQMGGTTPPIPSLVAPASLYLTAILESMCEHILSNVGRVAARDSSRTGATVQDVFVALCEDHSIYELFKSMRVYQQIELLTQAAKPRRSKSISRSDRPSLSRGSNQDLASSSSSVQHRSRGSTDTSATTSATSTTATLPAAATTTTTTTTIASSSRSSFDKARMKKLMTGSRNSSERDGDSQSGHKRSESVLSEDTKQTLAAYNLNESDPEDSAMLKEFDNLMRSDSTMKVSLTPDRLKTMEVYKQEKDGRGNRKPPPLAFPDSSSSRANGRRPSLRHVDSIVEDEEEPTSNNSSSAPPNKASRSSPNPPPLPMSHAKRGGPSGFDADPFPVKTRRIQKNRESLDLDAVMAGSDDEVDEEHAAPPPRTPSRNPASPSTPRRNPSSPRLASAAREGSTARDRTADTRDMIDFLNSGPPEPKVSAANRDMLEFLASAPSDHGVVSSNGASTIEGGKKSSGRLQRMMSRLAMGTSEKSRSQPSEDPVRGSKTPPPPTPVRTQGMTHQTSYGNLSSLANRPVPPRPPPIVPISPPASPSDDEYHNAVSRSRKTSVVQPGGSISQPGTPRRVMPTWEQQMADGQAPAVPTKSENVQSVNENVNGASVNGNGYNRPANGHVKNGTAEAQPPRSSSRRPSASASAAPEAIRRPKPVVQTQPLPQTQAVSPVSPVTRKPPPAITPVTTSPPTTDPAPAIVEDQARDMRRLLARATNADECRLLFDMFLVKSGVALEPTASSDDVPYPSPSISDNPHSARNASEVMLELALVELFLGGDEEQAPPRPRRAKKRSEPAPVAAAAPADAAADAQPRKYVTFAPVDASTRTVTEVGA